MARNSGYDAQFTRVHDVRTSWDRAILIFGVGVFRRYHLLVSKIAVNAKTHAVVLRSVPENIPVLLPSRQVFILPPTGDIFSIGEAGLHWHHICTTSGVRLLPGILDRGPLPARLTIQIF
jgi:hypothetical protein